MAYKKIKVLITDDSLFFRNILKKEIEKDPLIEVVGVAFDPIDAREKIKLLSPDIITLDVEMPKMNGITFLKKLMKDDPKKIVLVSSLNINVFDALDAGAVDFVKKPSMSSENELKNFFYELVSKIKIASLAKLKTNIEYKAVPTLTSSNNILLYKQPQKKVIAIGASTGGTEATLAVLKQLPKEVPAILVTQHMPAGFTKMYADRLNKICKFEVREAVNGDRVVDGLALIAPGDKQMRLAKDSKGYYVKCQEGEKVSGHCPSVDVLFESVANVASENTIGIILTGMGKDGANGLLKMKNEGAYTIGQDQVSCVVYGMPKVAYEIGGVQIQSPVENIANILIKQLNKE
ncbi:chemotaxis response regulator protein-glutamate methylesterase [Sedimentibacter sp. zth1]|uniref:protein-glutamate methylesterase/protein-glutamine glutaminase n=1 Tax=Sedimentibacter sp. zth1 TaxID=2816908 RepID=UPI001A9324FA|nr:chemotaxis response regulator protein-glutamate methylesterase [Sedimentibacter sp. zth1]QSX07168.1 chemotaxis response regulator protein-glutamate methylesterase [Sedimentibacter sp. zth1]